MSKIACQSCRGPRCLGMQSFEGLKQAFQLSALHGIVVDSNSTNPNRGKRARPVRRSWAESQGSSNAG